MIKLLSVCTLSSVIGIVAGWALHGSGSADSTESADPAASRIAQLVMPQPAQQSGPDLGQLHAAIREEIAAASQFRPGIDRQASTTSQASTPPSPALVAQRQDALGDIQGMIAGGEWGEGERAHFQQKFAALDPEQARKVLQQVVAGLNNGTIHAQTDLPL